MIHTTLLAAYLVVSIPLVSGGGWFFPEQQDTTHLRGLQEESRLIGWLGESHHVADKETPSAKQHRLWDAVVERGGWSEQLSWKPRAYLYHGFISEAEADHIVELAKPKVRRSTVVDSETGEVKTDPIRTSEQTFLMRGQDKVVTDVEERIASFAMIPYENGEDLQVLKYQNGQKYDAHHDVGELTSKSGQSLASDGGYRMATALVYLSTPEWGGETVFPYSEWIDESKATTEEYSDCGAMGVAAKPRKGDMLLFWSIDLNHNIDPASMHAGCPTLKGTKWTATKWMHESPFRWTAPPKPGQIPGCEDKNLNCPAWAAAGECRANPVFMVGLSEYPGPRKPGGEDGSCLASCKACVAKEKGSKPSKKKISNIIDSYRRSYLHE
eukprot:CAMPEP_0197864902 /NCGR_PEP_ID=MMETSP1438-20131217/43353_1 /TAXON_ID=1461541 /ORGANISM="Pterosperma sp., Strain CCMP1384" /LENGTH=382 /DNA_ID=CAMNT_0043483281 /DNA_START=103 /DNA_END=1251 /DNA_ORIENTATION=-